MNTRTRWGIPLALATFLMAGAFLCISLLAWVWRSSEFRHNTNLKQLGLCFAMYATHDSRDVHEYLPALSPRAGNPTIARNSVLSEYISYPRMLLSPADPSREDPRAIAEDLAFCYENSSYLYLGYFVWDDATVEAFAVAREKQVRSGGSFDTDLVADAPVHVLKRLDRGVYREMITDDDSEKPEWAYLKHPHSEIPVLIERPREYPGPNGLLYPIQLPLSSPTVGGCVLYLDGHTEFIEYPGKWPMTERTIKALTALSS